MKLAVYVLCAVGLGSTGPTNRPFWYLSSDEESDVLESDEESDLLESYEESDLDGQVLPRKQLRSSNYQPVDYCRQYCDFFKSASTACENVFCSTFKQTCKGLFWNPINWVVVIEPRPPTQYVVLTCLDAEELMT